MHALYAIRPPAWALSQVMMVLLLVLSQTRNTCLSLSAHDLEEPSLFTIVSVLSAFISPCVNLQILKLQNARLITGSKLSIISSTHRLLYLSALHQSYSITT